MCPCSVQEFYLFFVSQQSIRCRYLSGLLSPALLSPELVVAALSKVLLGFWLLVRADSASVSPDVAPNEVCLQDSGLLCVSAFKSLSSPASFPCLLGELSPILRNKYYC
ncbi:hypothetical protein CHARACLAT_008714 [Characodon lateralis]|uniref:Secreted protein n=1 Tax=Characodon lateralis TaxID=208331 RepID=A0ABU7EHQ0_9TELE|nr:hypothetical protein [Characodon lateralis]